MKSPFHIIYIAGYGRSGSTLLDLCLGSHSAVESLGEITDLGRVYRNGRQCSCLEEVRHCSFWKSVEEELSQLLAHKISLGDWEMMPRCVSDFRSKTTMLLEAIRQVTGKSVFVDSSKNPQRLQYYIDCGDIKVSVVHLIRHPLGVSAAIRKYGSKGILRLHRWKSINEEVFRILRKHQSQVTSLILRYEDFAANPEGAIREIDQKIGLSFEDSQLDFSGTPHHIPSGNLMRKALHEHLPIVPDMRWTDRVPLSERIYLSLTAFRFTKRLGYRVAMPRNGEWVDPI